MADIQKAKKKKKGFLEGYKTYEGPRGNPAEWKAAFFERMGVDKALEVLGANDPLTFFGLNNNATWADVQKAYRAAARKAHPDMGGSVDEMKKVNAAYEILESRMSK